MEETNNDLPLMSNISAIRARHYAISLDLDFDTKCFLGQMYIFFESTTLCESQEKFCLDNNCQCKREIICDDSNQEIVLDCRSIDIFDTYQVNFDPNVINTGFLKNCDKRNDENFLKLLKSLTVTKLDYTIHPWSININNNRLPAIIRIDYKTREDGRSLAWSRDANGCSCVYTAGDAINNRSLFPCQDMPSAMATWQAWIYVNKEYYVSMTGDEDPIMDDLSSLTNNKTCFYYHTTMVLPMATLAIAIGKWQVREKDIHTNFIYNGVEPLTCFHYPYECHVSRLRNEISEPNQSSSRISIVFASNLNSKTEPLFKFFPWALIAAQCLLGQYPFKRLQVVILPSSFGSLGLASPNIIFLSPIMLLDDPSAFIRFCHEIR